MPWIQRDHYQIQQTVCTQRILSYTSIPDNSFNKTIILQSMGSPGPLFNNYIRLKFNPHCFRQNRTQFILIPHSESFKEWLAVSRIETECKCLVIKLGTGNLVTARIYPILSCFLCGDIQYLVHVEFSNLLYGNVLPAF